MKKKSPKLFAKLAKEVSCNRIMRLFENYVEDRQHIENIQPIILFLMG